MHEYAIVQSLLNQVEVELCARRGTAVHSIDVRLGELSGVEPELLSRAFETFRAHTVCDGATLRLDRVNAKWGCPRCGRPIPRGQPLQCPDCLRPARLVQGSEIVLDRIELEVPDV